MLAANQNIRRVVASLFSILLVVGTGLGHATADSRAQTKFKAGISGRLTDPSGAVVVGANVSFIVRRTGNVVVTVKTNDSGEYAVDLEPGLYDVEADAGGFKKAKRKYIPVHSEGRSFVDFVLQPKPPDASTN
jgi:Carboxypeptidase regulatory-like domain